MVKIPTLGCFLSSFANQKNRNKMKHLIVPIDFSKDSINGLKMAIFLSKKIECHIQMVFVQDKVRDHSRFSLVEERNEAKSKFDKLVQEYTPKLGEGCRLSYIIKKGKVYKEVVEQAEAFDDSMLVCSTHGASGFEALFIGSNAFRIVTATDRPVITIRQGSCHKDIKKIILPIDITADSRQKVPLAAELAQRFDAEVHVVGITSWGAEDIEAKVKAYTHQVYEFLEANKIKVVKEYLEGDNITDVVLEYTKKVDGDLVCIMSEQSLSIANFVLGSYAQQMLNKSQVPVLIVHPKEVFVMGSFRTQGY